MTTLQPVLIDGRWREAQSRTTFQAFDPSACLALPEQFPLSDWTDCEAALDAAVEAFWQLRQLPADRLADFLDGYARRIEQRAEELVETAHRETALPRSPRLADVELPRTTNQLRQAAQAARTGTWTMPTIDTASNIRSCYAPIGPVCVFGPNNFPLAFGSISGGDFAAAIAAGNPVIAKANTSHPGTTRLFAEEALAAVGETRLPAATVQLLYRLDHEDGERLVSDPRVGATGYTGSRSAGLALKAAADAAGKPIYLELSSVNPVILLPGALQERADQIAQELTTSGLMGTGQFCTNPGLIILIKGDSTEQFVQRMVTRYQEAPVGTLLSDGVQKALCRSISVLREAGATVLVGGQPLGGERYCHANTLLQVDGLRFLEAPQTFQTEAFGNATLFVMAHDIQQVAQIVENLEGNLTGCVYSHTQGDDDRLYDTFVPQLCQRVGRLLNDKMPTGVAVSLAMNHGGPYPATGHPGFTAVGIPASLRRFAMLQCYDNVRPHRLPPVLQDRTPHRELWRFVDGQWMQGDVSS